MFQQIILMVFMGHCVLFSEAKINRYATDNPIVTTPLGQIKGARMTSRLGKTIYAFRGIRYAKPPVKELRFKPPEPVEKWEGVYNATEDGPLCPQPTTYPVSEDCLVLNVYSTKLPKDEDNPKRPVIVFIHAGGYYSVGSASYWHGPQYFMDQDIVLVTISYRLGTLGFLSTGDKEAPGNNGLKDQVQALRWVQQNIKAFGGDPDNVTIMGYSAGGWSIILHIVSPMSKGKDKLVDMFTGLFHKAVAMSGSPIGQWSLPQSQLELAKKQAEFVGCPTDTAANIIKCLKTKSFKELGDSLSKFEAKNAEKIVKYRELEDEIKRPWQMRTVRTLPIILSTTGLIPKSLLRNIKQLGLNEELYQPIQKTVLLATSRIVRKYLGATQPLQPPPPPPIGPGNEEFNYDPIIIWYPAIEADFGQERFLPAHPAELIKSGKFEKVPLITGVTADEFGYKAFGVINDESTTKEINDDFERIAPIAFLYERNTERSKNISRNLKAFYLHGKPVDKSQLPGLDHLYGDSVIGSSVNRAAKLIAEHSNSSVYYYRFSYYGRYSHFYLPDSNNTIPYDAVHHDDLIYLFYISAIFPYFNATSPEVEMVEKLTTIYANFAKTGKPIPIPTAGLDNVSWEPFTIKEQKYMDIGHKLVIKEKLHQDRYAEWEKLFPLHL